MKYHKIFGFSGINRNVADFLPEEGEFSEAVNLTTSKIGVLKKTGDYEIKGAQITASKDILGGIDFARADGTHDHFVAIDGTNSNIYYYTSGSWTSQSLSRTATEKIRFAYSPTLDHLFACNITDDTTGWNGSAWSTSTNLTSAPKAKFPIMFGRRLYLLNVNTGTAYINRYYRSSLVDSGSITWDVTNDWGVFDDVITGVGKNGENMFIGCENSIWILTLGDEKYQVASHGCVSHESITSYGKWTFWAARDGIYAFNGGSSKKISSAIQEYWDGVPEANLDDIQMEVLGHNLHIYLGDITSPSTLTNVGFIYDILQNNFNRLAFVDEVKHLHTYVTSSGKKLFMGNDNGEIFEMFSSATQNTAVFGSFIETNWFYGSGIEYEDDFYEFWGYGNKLSGLKVSYKVDDSGWKPAGELNGSLDSVEFKKRAYRIKFLLQEVSKNNLYDLQMLQIGYVPSHVKEEDAK